jgi:hypothetical protein
VIRHIGFAGCMHTTPDVMKIVLRSGYAIDCLSMIDPVKGKEQNVAGYLNLRPFCEDVKISCNMVLTSTA